MDSVHLEHVRRRLAALEVRFRLASGPAAAEIALRAAAAALEVRLPVPEWAGAAVVDALATFDAFEARTLGEAFGVPDHVHTAAKRARLEAPLLVDDIEALRATGLSLDDAIAQVSGDYHKSPAQVKKLRDDWLQQHRMEAEPPPTATAAERVASAIARGLTPAKKTPNV